MALTIVAVLVVVGVVLAQTVFAPPARVENVSLENVGESYILRWDGPNVPYSVLLIGEKGSVPTDFSSSIRNGREAWLPRGGGKITADSCLIVVPESRLNDLDSNAADSALADHGAGKICVDKATKS
ncbi:hypothetical protein M2390_001874 [Mycetocola sp. BIGb0189]|uniref:hypothetical protein n=1 Tax=Mycetocola sp. BIGb0189 TaxID=2940604 RepID=UPI002166CDCD|nr:hypothetical protein [Mycetocola sp. BIGb0189]MCS4276680.1 hypothetical protein [Mycetocola sp. BIGb0189]